MNTKTSCVIALLAFAAAPFATQAADPSSSAAFDACIKAFTSTQLPGHTVQQTRTDNSYVATTLQLSKPHSFEIAVRARGVTSGKTLAEARCLVDREGVVLIQESRKYAVTVKDSASTL